jgi:hypothetical protein
MKLKNIIATGAAGNVNEADYVNYRTADIRVELSSNRGRKYTKDYPVSFVIDGNSKISSCFLNMEGSGLCHSLGGSSLARWNSGSNTMSPGCTLISFDDIQNLKYPLVGQLWKRKYL